MGYKGNWNKIKGGQRNCKLSQNENFKIEAASSSIDSTVNYIRDVEYRLDGENHRAFRGKGMNKANLLR